MSSDADEPSKAEHIWEGDWRSRVYSRLRSLGFQSMLEFLARFPSEPYLKLAARLGADFAALQIISTQFREAREGGSIREAAKDCLVREINGQLRRGWGRGGRVDFQTAGVYANWMIEVTRAEPDVRPMVDVVWRELKNLNPDEGWLPSSPDDPLVLAAFSRRWPVPAELP
jgi:hypothetical protein